MMKKIHLSNFKKKNGAEAYKVVIDAIGASPTVASEVNIAKITEKIKDPVVSMKFKTWSSGYDFAVISQQVNFLTIKKRKNSLVITE